MKNGRKISLDLLSSEEIDDLIEPDSLQARKTAQGEDLETQMALVAAKFPHVGRMLRTTWGTQEFYPYMDSIMFTNRPDRVGFPPPVVVALTTLLRLHGRICPRVGGPGQTKGR